MKVFSLFLLISLFHFGNSDDANAISVLVQKIAANEFVETFKGIADIAGPFASAFSFVMDLFFESESERFERYFQDIFKKLDEIQVKLDTIEELILNLEVKLSFMSKELLKDIKFVNFEANLLGISSSIYYFKNTLLKFNGSQREFLRRLDKFIDSYEMNNYENRLISSAVERVLGQPSLVDLIISFLNEGRETVTDNADSSSTMQTIYELHLLIIEKVSQGDAMMNICHSLKSELSGQNSSAIAHRRSSITEKLITSMKSSMKRLEDNRKSFLNFDRVKEVKLKNVIQYFWQNEYELTKSEKTCYYTCSYFKNVFYSADGCYGRVRNCEFKMSVFTSEQQLKVR